jgi:hypothetical protein
MPHTSTPPFDLPQAHKWFAVACNNLAWNIIERAERSADDVERLIHTAHASVHHWLQVGRPVNVLRGQILLATAYSTAGLAEAAVRYAEQALSLGREVGDAQNAFDRATAHGCAAAAYKLAGRSAETKTHHDQCRTAAAELDAEDRAVVEKLYPRDFA